jgi:hypothetical protein
VKPRPPVIVRLGPERTDEQVALGYLLESLDRLPSVFRRLRFLVALRDLYATTPPARRAAELLVSLITVIFQSPDDSVHRN